MTTPTKPTKEATTPLPVLKEERVRELRDGYAADVAARAWAVAGSPAGYALTASQELLALADHWLRTQAGDDFYPLYAFDTAVDAELARVSHVEYDAHEICKHFAAELRKRLAPPQEPA